MRRLGLCLTLGAALLVLAACAGAATPKERAEYQVRERPDMRD